MRRRARQVWQRGLPVVVAGLIFCAVTAGGAEPSTTGHLRGRVRNHDGKPVAEATLWFVGHTSTGVTVRNLQTNEEGRFDIGPLPPGRYAVRVSRESYEPNVKEEIRLASGEERWLEFHLTAETQQGKTGRSLKELAAEDWRWVLRTSGLSARSILRFFPDRSQVAGRRGLGEGRVVVGSLGAPDSGVPTSAMGTEISFTALDSLTTNVLVTGGSSSETARSAFVTTEWDPQGLVDGPSVFVGVGLQALPRTSAADPHQLRLYRAGTSHEISLPGEIDLEYRLDYLRVSFGGSRAALLPVLELRRALDDSTVLLVAYRSEKTSLPFGPDEIETGPEARSPAMLIPALTRRNGDVRLERLRHQEIGIERNLEGIGRLQGSLFRETITDSAIPAEGGNSALPTNMLFRATAGNSRLLNGGDYSTTGLRLALVTPWSDRFETLVSYAYSRGLIPGEPTLAPEQDLSDALVVVPVHTLGARVSTEIPFAQTHLRVDYSWLSEPTLTNPIEADSSERHLDPYLGVQLRQPIPAVFFLPPGLTLLADARNLLNQGESTVTLPNGARIALLPVQRSFRGGLAYRF